MDAAGVARTESLTKTILRLRGEGVLPLRDIDPTGAFRSRALCHTAHRWWVVAIALGCLGLPLSAQEARTPNWEVIRKSTFETLDRRTVQQWAEGQIQELLTGKEVQAVQQAGADFYAALTGSYRAADATNEFKNGAAEIINTVFTAQYKPAAADQGGSNPLGTSIVLMALRDMAHRVGLPSFRAALSDPTPGPRLIAAEGFIALREGLNDADWAAVLPALQNAGSGETHPLVMARIYRALSTDTAARTDGAAAAILAILNARFTTFSQQAQLPVLADGEAAAWLAGKVERSNNAQLRTSVCQHIARLMVEIVDAYLSVKLTPTQQEQLERAMLAAEPALGTLVRSISPNAAIPEPTLRAVMLGAAQGREDKLEAVLTQWVGSSAAAGLLNQPPFNLPRGMNAQRKAHRSTDSAPAASEPEGTQPGE